MLYSSLESLLDQYGAEIREADCVMVGSYVHRGIEVGDWVTQHAKGDYRLL